MATSNSSSGSTSNKRTQLFLQTATLNGTEIPRAMIISCAYMEHGELTGPQLMLEIMDASNYIVNQLKCQFGSTLVCSMGDPEGLGQVQFNETFFVIKAPYQGDKVILLALSAAVRTLKIKATAPQFFVDKQPSAILSQLCGNLTVNADSVTKTSTYHLNAGQKPAAVIEEVARDAGALCWTSRGAINIKTLKKLANKTASMTYESNNPKADYPITRYNLLNKDDQYKQSRQYRLASYSMTKGMVYYGDETLPLKMVSNPDKTAMSNQNSFLMPKFDMEVTGNAALMPGVMLKVLVHTYDSESALDESVPTNMIIERVTHYEDRLGYMSRVVLGEVVLG